MRRNDIIERLLRKRSGGDSLLMALEKDFIATATSIVDPVWEDKLKGVMDGEVVMSEGMEGMEGMNGMDGMDGMEGMEGMRGYGEYGI